LGEKASSSAARCTRSRVASATSVRALSAFDAVATETPARRATSPSVTASDRRLPIEILSKTFRPLIAAG
jgi:hypothetical protein